MPAKEITPAPYYEDGSGEVHHGECLSILKKLPNQCVQSIITSPPYFGLRDYGTGEWERGDPKCPHVRESKKSDKTITGHKNFDEMLGVGDAIQKSTCHYCGATRVDKQIGLEESPDEYIKKLVDVFREARRVLQDDGTLWLNLGDSYAGNGKGQFAEGEHDPKKKKTDGMKLESGKTYGLKSKDLMGIPWRVALALQADGWWLRQDIIWSKGNPMPESVTDRCTKAHEYIFLLSKSARYYFDAEAIKEPSKDDWGTRNRANGKYPNEGSGLTPHSGLEKSYEKANKRSVWVVNTKPFTGAHFAVFPPKLIEPCVLAGCPKGGVVLDPFMGSGTTGYVAKQHGRRYIGIELNEKYIEIAKTRLQQEVLF